MGPRSSKDLVIGGNLIVRGPFDNGGNQDPSMAISVPIDIGHKANGMRKIIGQLKKGLMATDFFKEAMQRGKALVEKLDHLGLFSGPVKLDSGWPEKFDRLDRMASDGVKRDAPEWLEAEEDAKILARQDIKKIGEDLKMIVEHGDDYNKLSHEVAMTMPFYDGKLPTGPIDAKSFGDMVNHRSGGLYDKMKTGDPDGMQLLHKMAPKYVMSNPTRIQDDFEDLDEEDFNRSIQNQMTKFGTLGELNKRRKYWDGVLATTDLSILMMRNSEVKQRRELMRNTYATGDFRKYVLTELHFDDDLDGEMIGLHYNPDVTNWSYYPTVVEIDEYRTIMLHERLPYILRVSENNDPSYTTQVYAHVKGRMKTNINTDADYSSMAIWFCYRNGSQYTVNTLDGSFTIQNGDLDFRYSGTINLESVDFASNDNPPETWLTDIFPEFLEGERVVCFFHGYRMRGTGGGLLTFSVSTQNQISFDLTNVNRIPDALEAPRLSLSGSQLSDQYTVFDYLGSTSIYHDRSCPTDIVSIWVNTLMPFAPLVGRITEAEVDCCYNQQLFLVKMIELVNSDVMWEFTNANRWEISMYSSTLGIKKSLVIKAISAAVVRRMKKKNMALPKTLNVRNSLIRTASLPLDTDKGPGSEVELDDVKGFIRAFYSQVGNWMNEDSPMALFQPTERMSFAYKYFSALSAALHVSEIIKDVPMLDMEGFKSGAELHKEQCAKWYRAILNTPEAVFEARDIRVLRTVDEQKPYMPQS